MVFLFVCRKPSDAPFFLPTVGGLGADVKFDLDKETRAKDGEEEKVFVIASLTTLAFLMTSRLLRRTRAWSLWPPHPRRSPSPCCLPRGRRSWRRRLRGSRVWGRQRWRRKSGEESRLLHIKTFPGFFPFQCSRTRFFLLFLYCPVRASKYLP